MGRFKLESYHGRSLESGPTGYDGITGASEENNTSISDEDIIRAALECIPEERDDDIIEMKDFDTEDIEPDDFGMVAKRVADYPLDRPDEYDLKKAENEIDEIDNSEDFDI